MHADQRRETDALRAARKRRAGLHDVLVDLEAAIAAPPADERSDWSGRVRAVLRRLQDTFSDHLEGTEGDGGLFDEVVELSPRLANSVQQLRDEHAQITEAINEALAALDRAAQAPPADTAADVRQQVLRLLVVLARHRQSGADLVYGAYKVDIGGSQ